MTKSSRPQANPCTHRRPPRPRARDRREDLRPETLAAASARIIDLHAKLPLAERWGGGEVASIDGLRFVVPRRTIHAADNRRYFDRRRGVTLLGTTADHYAGLHTVVITGTQPDAPYMCGRARS